MLMPGSELELHNRIYSSYHIIPLAVSDYLYKFMLILYWPAAFMAMTRPALTGLEESPGSAISAKTSLLLTTMPVTEFATLAILPSHTSRSPSTQAFFQKVAALQSAWSGYPLYFFEDANQPTIIYLISGWRT